MNETTPELEDRVGMQTDCRIVAFPEVRPTEHLFCVIVTDVLQKLETTYVQGSLENAE